MLKSFLIEVLIFMMQFQKLNLMKFKQVFNVLTKCSWGIFSQRNFPCVWRYIFAPFSRLFLAVFLPYIDRSFVIETLNRTDALLHLVLKPVTKKTEKREKIYSYWIWRIKLTAHCVFRLWNHRFLVCLSKKWRYSDYDLQLVLISW